MKSFLISEMKAGSIYHLMISAVVPRPIAWVSTISPEGKGNLAPFSYFNAVSSDPATLVFSCAIKPDGNPKDTLINILKTKQFVVNVANVDLLAQVNQTSAEYPYGVNELEKVGLTPVASTLVKPSRVKEAPVQIECELYDTLKVGEGQPGSSTLVVGKILAIHVDPKILDPKDPKGMSIDEIALNPLTRLGGQKYGTLGKVIESQRPGKP
ncbi:MAG: flavin reductase family protein [Bdellovibrionales bacterium]|nr:flavin reductase family protein [Bdellovibrionales bacterium]